MLWADLLGHGDALSVDERQDLVVVHHRVHALDPQRVDRPVEHQPLLVRLLVCEANESGHSHLTI